MRRRITGLIVVVSVLGLGASAVSADIATGLVGYWPLDGDAMDASGNGLDGIINGDVVPIEDRFGNADGAMLFSGASDAYIDLGDAPGFRLTGEMTLAAWVYLDADNTNNGRIFSKQAGGGSRSWSLNVEANSGGVANPGTFQIASNGNTIVGINDQEPLPTDAWVHLAGVYKPGEAMELYVNGELKVSDTSGVPASQFSDNGSTALIGSRNACGNCGWMGAIDEVRIYERALTASDIRAVFRGDTTQASEPDPAHEAVDVGRDAVLSWTPGEFAERHDVYLGTAFEDVNGAGRTNPMDVLISEGQETASYDVGRLEFGQTYYWRVDEVNGAPDNTIFKGSVWSFAVEPFAYPVEGIVATASHAGPGAGPENTVNGSGLNERDEHSVGAGDMWLAAPSGDDPVCIQYEFDRTYKLHEMLVWNYNVQFELVLGFGIKDITVEYSVDGVDWAALGDAQFAQATATTSYVANTAVDLGGVAARYVKLNVLSGWGMLPQYGLSEVRFMHVPAFARQPEPADKTADVPLDTALHWRSGREAAVHEVYFGTGPDALPLLNATTEATSTPDVLDFGTAYYWRVDEVNEAEAVSVWEGDIWSFSTLEFAVIDDLESYDDEENRIFDAWLDGFVNGTGSTVGYFEAPFAERSIVNGGRQSMPLEYANGAAPFYSEAEYDLGSMDLTVNGAATLRLFVAGQTDNTVEPLYVALEDASGNVAVVTHPDPAIVATPGWTEWQIPHGELNGINLSRAAVMYIGVGDRDNPSAGGAGTIFIDDIGYGKPAVAE